MKKSLQKIGETLQKKRFRKTKALHIEILKIIQPLELPLQ